ncbi:MAG: hypothetical protein WBA74_05705 [Cyclobacteriaceae bacterium]
MKHLINIQVGWSHRRLSVLESSEQIFKLLKSLYEVEKRFENPTLSKLKYDDVVISLKNTSEVEIISNISQTILNFSKDDIQKYEDENRLSVEYSRDIGFSFVLRYNDLATFNIIIGSSIAGGIATTKLSIANMSWYFKLLKGVIEVSSVIEGAIELQDMTFSKSLRVYRAPLGLITYFSNDYEIPIPDDLEGIEYEYTDKGKYLILTQENIAKDEAKLEEAKQKLLKTMQAIADRVPEYKK